MSSTKNLLEGFAVADHSESEPTDLDQLKTDAGLLMESARLKGLQLRKYGLMVVNSEIEKDFTIGGEHRSECWSIIPQACLPDTPFIFWQAMKEEDRIEDVIVYSGDDPIPTPWGCANVVAKAIWGDDQEILSMRDGADDEGWTSHMVVGLVSDKVRGTAGAGYLRRDDLDSIFVVSCKQDSEGRRHVVLEGGFAALGDCEVTVRDAFQKFAQSAQAERQWRSARAERQKNEQPTIGQLTNGMALSSESWSLLVAVLVRGASADGGHPLPDAGTVRHFTGRYLIECAQRAYDGLTREAQVKLEDLFNRVGLSHLYHWRTGRRIHWRKWSP